MHRPFIRTERLYLEPTREFPAIVRWDQKVIGMRHIEFGASYQCLQVPILEDIAHVEGIPDPERGTFFLIDYHCVLVSLKITRT